MPFLGALALAISEGSSRILTEVQKRRQPSAPDGGLLPCQKTGYRLVNADFTVIANSPLSTYIEQMREATAAAIGAAADQIGVKATTVEGKASQAKVRHRGPCRGTAGKITKTR
jgi:hypothetical protein